MQEDRLPLAKKRTPPSQSEHITPPLGDQADQPSPKEQISPANQENLPHNRDRLGSQETDSSKKPLFACDECDSILSSTENLERHMKVVHQGWKPFQCSLCTYAASRAYRLKAHMRESHDSTQEKQLTQKPWKETPLIKCNVCSFAATDKASLTSHINVEHLHVGEKCNPCAKIFPCKTSLLRHQRRSHPELTAKSFKCVQCEFSAIAKSSLTRHIQLRHTLNSSKCALLSDTEGERQFRCKTCGKQFSSQKNLKVHIDCVHLALKRYECSRCDYQCGDCSNFREHLATHIDVGETISVHTGMGLVTVTKTGHARGLKLFSCDKCSYTTVYRQEIKEHLTSHLEVKPFKCELCSKSFSTPRRVTVHHRDVHSGARFECHVCAKAVKTKRTLTQHMRFTHPGLSEDST